MNYIINVIIKLLLLLLLSNQLIAKYKPLIQRASNEATVNNIFYYCYVLQLWCKSGNLKVS